VGEGDWKGMDVLWLGRKGGSPFGKVVALETFFKKKKKRERKLHRSQNPFCFLVKNYFILKIWFDIVCLSLSFFFGGGDFAFPKNHFFKVIDRHEVHS